MVQSLAVFLLKEGHSDLGFVGFAQLWDPCVSGTVDDNTSHLNHVKKTKQKQQQQTNKKQQQQQQQQQNHIADEVKTVSCMVIG